MNLNVKTEILLSTCIGHKIIEKYCKANDLNLKCVPETRPLGTFGALANVVSKNISEKYLILNGDTIFKANFQNIYQSYINHKINKPLIILKKVKKNLVMEVIKRIRKVGLSPMKILALFP